MEYFEWYRSLRLKNPYFLNHLAILLQTDLHLPTTSFILVMENGCYYGQMPQQHEFIHLILTLTIDTFVEFTGICCNERQDSRFIADKMETHLIISNANDFSGHGLNIMSANVITFTTNNSVISAHKFLTSGTEYTNWQDSITTYNSNVPYPYFDAHDDAFIVGPYNRVLFPDWDNDESPDY